MSAAVPESDLTTEQLLKLANFRREDADDLDAALAGSGVDVFTSSEDGLTPASGGGEDNYLRADGTWSEPPGEALGYYNVVEYGATGLGVADDAPAIRLAIAAAKAASGGVIYFPTGTYRIGRDGVTGWCLLIDSDNITIQGVPGRSVIRMANGLANQVRGITVDNAKNFILRDVVLDGDWGNAVVKIATASDGTLASSGTYTVEGDMTNFPSSGTFKLVNRTSAQVITYTGKTVTATGGTFTGCTGGDASVLKLGFKCGYIEDETALNYVFDADPKNHTLMLRGTDHALVENVQFKQCYGDFIWMGYASDGIHYPRDTQILRCHGDISARNAVTVGQSVDGLVIDGCTWDNIHSQAFDSEPNWDTFFFRNASLLNTRWGIWWNPHISNANSPVSVWGGSGNVPGPENYARNISIEGCDIEGGVWVQDTIGLTIRKNRITCDHGANTIPAVVIQQFNQDILVEDNDIYTRTGGAGNYSAIYVSYYTVGTDNRQPTNIVLRKNNIRSTNGKYGIYAQGTGGLADQATGMKAPETNTFTSVTATTATRAAAGWTVNYWAGFLVRVGTAIGAVVSNTNATLTVTGWYEERSGRSAATPTAGVYAIYQPTGYLDIDENTIDTGNDGWGAGLYGIALGDDRAGMRVRVRGNKLKNCTDWGVYIAAVFSNRPFLHLEISDNVGWDDQASPTFNAVVRILEPAYINKLIIRNNSAVGVPYPTTIISGLSASTTLKNYLVNDGNAQEWAGYGTPEGVVYAPVGATYQQLDVSTGSTLWKKDSGTGNTGWINAGETCRPNLVRNSGFWFAQRQAPGVLTTYDSTAGRALSADGWAITNQNASAQFIRVDALTPEAGLAARYYGSFTKITATGKVLVSQVIEGVEVAKLRGRSVRLQAKIKGTAAAVIRLGLAQLTSAGTVDVIPGTFATFSGTGSVDHTLGTNLSYISPTAGYADNAAVVGTGLDCSVTTAWQRFGGVFAVPSNCKNLVVMVWSNETLTAANGFSLSEVTLVDGLEIQTWTPGDLTAELARCRRFYQKTFAVDTLPAQNVGVNTGELVSALWKAGATAAAAIVPWRFVPEMRAAPTITTYNPAAANAEARQTGGVAADLTATAAGGITVTQTVITGTGVGTGAAGDAISVHATADCDL